MEAAAKPDWNKIKENFRNRKQRTECIIEVELAVKSCQNAFFFNKLSVQRSDGKPQQSHSNFININKTSVTETFEQIVPMPESYPRDSNFKVAPK